MNGKRPLQGLAPPKCSMHVSKSALTVNSHPTADTSGQSVQLMIYTDQGESGQGYGKVLHEIN